MKLKPYQEEAIDSLTGMDRAYVRADTGAGKTAIVLHTLCRRRARRVLVVAPYYVALTTWHAEARKWKLPYIVHVLTGKPALARRKLLQKDEGGILVMNYELLPWLVRCQHPKFDVIVLDEITKVKNNQGARNKALRKLSLRTPTIWGLTATPISTSLLDLYGQINVLESKAANPLGRSMTAYRQQYFYPVDANMWKWNLRRGAEEGIYAAIKPLSLTVPAESYRQTPSTTVPVTIDLPKEVTKTYKEAVKECIVELNGTTVTFDSAGILTGKLLQITGGALYVEGEKGTYMELHEAKLGMLKTLIESFQGKPCVVVYHFKHEAERINELIPEAVLLTGKKGWEAENIINRFNDGDINTLLIHPASAAHGINLHRSCYHMVFFSGTWSQEQYVQTIGRLARQGQMYTVRVYHLLAKGTIDEYQLDVCQGRVAENENLIEALK